jgi:hypothetical protein
MDMQNPIIASPPSEGVQSMPILLNTPLDVSPGFFADLLSLWAGMAWLSGRNHPERPWTVRLLAGAISGFVLILADVGHAFAHTLSARLAGAPVDRIKLSSGMPRTIYDDNQVSPRTHRMRASGGPIFSALGLGLSLLAHILLPHDSIAREVAGWSCIGHGLILTGSLAPLPIVDGGSLLKWTLVERGRSPVEADQVVRQAGIVTGIAASSAGVMLATRRRWLPAAGLIAAGFVAFAAAIGKIR